MGLFWTRGYRTVQTAHCVLVHDKPAVLVALRAPLKVLGFALLLVNQVLSSNSSCWHRNTEHGVHAFAFPCSPNSPARCMRIRQCGPNQDQEKAEAKHLQDENISTTMNFTDAEGL